MRIAIAGFQHETNTFVSKPTELSDFEQADSWPALLSGQDVITGTEGMNLPIAGFAEAARAETCLPILWASAEPGGKVTDRAFEAITGRITDALAAMGALDAVYLDLHGAMVTATHDDGEGEILARVRAVVGADVPVVASLDMHANISAKMIEIADALTIFRSYPHIDMAETGGRAFEVLRLLVGGERLAKAWAQAGYAVPLHAQHTGAAPWRDVYGQLEGLAPGGTAELALGFSAADIADMGPVAVAYAPTQAAANAALARVMAALDAAEHAFDAAMMTPEGAVASATQLSAQGPVVIADVQDNPGAGASSDTTGLLRALLDQNAPETLLGLMHDPDLARQAHAAGEGASFEARIGGRGPGDSPVPARVRVLRVSDGQCRYTGEMYGGGVASLGPSAALAIEGSEITVVVTSIRNQCLDQAHFTHFGLDPARARIVCVKSTAHFRADFEPIAHRVLVAAAPGLFPCALDAGQYTKLRPGMRFPGQSKG